MAHANGFRPSTFTHIMSDRRLSSRVPGSTLPSLTALTSRSTMVEVVDISDGGVLIDTPICIRPGQREIVVLDARSSIKVAGRAVRVEITRLFPSVNYRTAIRFAAPIAVGALTRSQEGAIRRISREVLERFTGLVRSLPGVHAVCVSAVWKSYPGTEPVHFAVPVSDHGSTRVLQVFFTQGTIPTAAQFGRLRRMALLVPDLPDFDIGPFASQESAAAEPAGLCVRTADLRFQELPARRRSSRRGLVTGSAGDAANRIVTGVRFGAEAGRAKKNLAVLSVAHPN